MDHCYVQIQDSWNLGSKHYILIHSTGSNNFLAQR